MWVPSRTLVEVARGVARWAALLAFLALLAAVLLAAPVSGDSGEELDLARVCVGEAGLQVETGDCAAIVFLLDRRARRQGISLRRMARAYSGRHVGVEASPRPWVAGLRRDGRAPAEWPASAPPWSRYRPRWLDVLDYVAEVRRGIVLDPCPGSHHWGGAMDDWRAERAGWVRVECDVETRNHFWRVP